jgi:OPA family glycerol-3-phosphate transporter-like MFS transporter
MVSHITRINFGAVISAIRKDTGFSNDLLSLSVAGSFVTYGAGQVVSGIFGDRVSPKKLVTLGLGLTVCMNLLMTFCQNPWQMLAVWSVNGFAQSFMWPPMVKILAQTLNDDDYKFAVNKVSWGSSAGTIFVYLTAPLLLSLLSWRWVFICSAIMGFGMIFVWERLACDVESAPRAQGASKGISARFFTPVLLGVLVAIILQGMLRDGVTTWMPTYIQDTYYLSNEISILTGVILPVFSVLCYQFATNLYTKKFTNPILCAALMFSVGAVSALAIRFTAGQNAALSVILFALLTGGMHGANLMLVGMVPQYFKKTGKVSTVSGILNAATYIGSALSTYGIAALSDAFGWNFTLILWLGIAACGAALCLVCGKFWKNYVNQMNG